MEENGGTYETICWPGSQLIEYPIPKIHPLQFGWGRIPEKGRKIICNIQRFGIIVGFGYQGHMTRPGH